MATNYEEVARVFKAFCDPRRLQILELLRSGEKCACMLQGELDFGQSALSYHMKILCESGIVASRQEGKWTHYRLSQSDASAAIGLLHRLTTPDPEQQCECAEDKCPLTSELPGKNTPC